MKIGIVALTYHPGTAGGIETYFQNLIAELQRADQVNQYIIFLPKSSMKVLPIWAKNFSEVAVHQGLVKKVIKRLQVHLFRTDASQAAKIESYKCDILHFPLQILEPPRIQGKVVLSSMDIQQEYLPQMFNRADLEARRLSYRPSAERADHIITISHFSKESLIEKYHIDPAKITVAHLGYDSRLYTSSPVETELQLPKPYFYYPAATWPHKNHLALLKAFQLFLRDHPEFSLVFSGIKKQKNDQIEQHIVSLHLEKKVVMTGYLPQQQLPALYQQAYAMVYPSLFEGFGIPLLEAMACGCPVIASLATSVPEVAQEAALYFNPADVNDIAAKMGQLVSNPSLRKSLVEKGNEQIKQFSNRKVAEETLMVYNKVYGT